MKEIIFNIIGVPMDSSQSWPTPIGSPVTLMLASGLTLKHV